MSTALHHPDAPSKTSLPCLLPCRISIVPNAFAVSLPGGQDSSLFLLASEDASLPKPMAFEGRARNLASPGCHRACYFPTSCSPPSVSSLGLTMSGRDGSLLQITGISAPPWVLHLFVVTSGPHGQSFQFHGGVLSPY